MAEVVLFIIFVVFFIVSVLIIILCFVWAGLKKLSLNINMPDDEIEAEALKMIDFFGAENDVKFKKSYGFSYDPKNKEINYKSNNKYSYLNIISIFHEIGHHLTEKSYYRAILIIISINRVLIFPLFLISLFININFLTIIIFALFAAICFLRLTVGMYWEYAGSKKAFVYIKHYFPEYNMISSAKKVYSLDFAMQFLLAVFVFLFIAILFVLSVFL